MIHNSLKCSFLHNEYVYLRFFKFILMPTLLYFHWSRNVNAWLLFVTDLGLFCETALSSFIVRSQEIKQTCYTVPTSVLYSVKMSVICLTAAIRKGDLPLVKVQQLSRLLAFGLGLHNIPVLVIHTPPCGWILTGKQSTHGSRELTASPANTQNKVCRASIVLKPHCFALAQHIQNPPSFERHLEQSSTAEKLKMTHTLKVLLSCDDTSGKTGRIPARW